ncbi:MAG: hypothetical protein A2817_02030 [Candidatus Yanofskybacteria bacterium RIFCSPHIGHO2_01_FULL_39_8b]|uniref:Fido domain-containing protein n=1 Tax=Candidatus Yanofskybacteria bacterium RIFCSPHIGHO2_01_FULL_39_8b TaxID=1802659 RepID=A0A1F8EAZ4_9BACT|nr:MAG: hypothetical protein A2817_02030 [Candidatus Yanofskybacteria bacterium RIFCSPHIGHO2_01_FULL_39_8b]
MDPNNIITDICREITEKRAIIESDSDYGLRLTNRHNTALARIANVNSWWLEHPELRRRIYHNARSTRNVRRNLARATKVAEKCSEKAWSYLREHSPLDDNLNHRMLLDLAGIIEEENDRFRSVRATLGFAEYCPPNPLKIGTLLDETFETMNSIRHPVEAAIYLHLRIAGIQPFNDGNKRVARLLQNRYLYEKRLPPPSIAPSERGHYLDLLEHALSGYRDEIKLKMVPFYSYLGTKINTALDEIIDGNASVYNRNRTFLITQEMRLPRKRE